MIPDHLREKRALFFLRVTTKNFIFRFNNFVSLERKRRLSMLKKSLILKEYRFVEKIFALKQFFIYCNYFQEVILFLTFCSIAFSSMQIAFLLKYHLCFS